MLIRTEQTPNPSTRKFLPEQTVMEAGTRDFPDAEAAEASPLASALFSSGMVEGVFYGRDFISVTAAPGVSWGDLEPVVLETLLDHFLSGAPRSRISSKRAFGLRSPRTAATSSLAVTRKAGSLSACRVPAQAVPLRPSR
jgi:hypothetical protein